VKVTNVHQRLLAASPERVGALIDALASPADAMWRQQDWPRMMFDGPLAIGAAGGHGPIRYFVESYTPGHSIRFRFTRPAGLNGWHGLKVLDATASHCVLEHRIEMRTEGWAVLTWPLVFGPLHDALIEDALSLAQESLGLAPHKVPWSWHVRLLRSLAPRRRRPSPGSERTRHA
jgi:hypothetical protein